MLKIIDRLCQATHSVKFRRYRQRAIQQHWPQTRSTPILSCLFAPILWDCILSKFCLPLSLKMISVLAANFFPGSSLSSTSLPATVYFISLLLLTICPWVSSPAGHGGDGCWRIDGFTDYWMCQQRDRQIDRHRQTSIFSFFKRIMNIPIYALHYFTLINLINALNYKK